ncbi:MAG: 16S rRNA (guanine(966)-N(2))-methyltransferase RsmD, partial [Burkholderiaceae bacterium]|nr:16S rRNA (guanine(966)-N(2))-methyltransferase RsmD [Burkholderiaceae bacterium]
MASRTPAPRQQNAATPTRAHHTIRIIGGAWRRSQLPVASQPGLRPTPDRVRETLFNWLGQNLAGWRVIDAFAGTGALGLEAASRGAAQVLLVEQDAALVASLEAAIARLRAQTVRVRRGDAIAALQQLAGSAPASVDLLLLDPPYDERGLYAPALQAAGRLLAPAGWIYLEAAQPWTQADLSALGGWTLHRHLKAGAVHAHLL